MERIIFDNGGFITLQLPGFSHTYQLAEDAADDILVYAEDGHTHGWEGDELDAIFEPSVESIHNGGYRVFGLIEFCAELPRHAESSWANISGLARELIAKGGRR